MSDEGFKFYGETTFINKPTRTVIQNFQNQYITGNGSDGDKVNTELAKLIELILTSKELPDQDKEEAVKAVQDVAGQVKEEKANKFTIKGTLQAVQAVIEKTADIAAPAMGIFAVVAKLLGY